MVHHCSRIISVLLIILCWLVPMPALADGTTEVLMSASNADPLGITPEAATVWSRLGQRLAIPNRTVTAIGYKVWRVGNPTGDIVFSIREAETDENIISVVWGDASELPTLGQGGARNVTLENPVTVNGDVRICVEYYGGNETDYCKAGYFAGDKKTGEWYTNYCQYATSGQWHDIGEAEEGSYYYAYLADGHTNMDEAQPDTESPRPSWPIIAVVIAAVIISFCVYFKKRRRG